MTIPSFTIKRNTLTGKTLTPTNSKYISKWNGTYTNPGTIDEPLSSYQEANALFTNGAGTYVVRGEIDDFIINGAQNGIYMLGEQDARVNQINTTGLVSGSSYIKDMKISKIISTCTALIDCNIDYLDARGNPYSFRNFVQDCFIGKLLAGALGDDHVNFKNNTILDFVNNLNYHPSLNLNQIQDSIIINSIDLYKSGVFTYLPILKNCLLFKTTKFLWNKKEIPVNYTTEENRINDVITALKEYATNHITNIDQQNYLIQCADHLFGAGTVIYDDSAPNVRVFNAYDADGNPTDYTLNFDIGNPAMRMSSTKDYVGCYKPNLLWEWDWENLENIDENGNALSEAPNLLLNNNGIYPDIHSAQKRNRLTANKVFSFPNGNAFSRLDTDFTGEANSGYYFGLWEERKNDVIPVDCMLAKIYDTAEKLSEYPPIGIPFNKACEIYYHKEGSRKGKPVLFNDLENLGIETAKNLTEAGPYAVTNAFAESIALSELTGVEVKKLYFKYMLPVLIINNTL